MGNIGNLPFIRAAAAAALRFETPRLWDEDGSRLLFLPCGPAAAPPLFFLERSSERDRGWEDGAPPPVSESYVAERVGLPDALPPDAVRPEVPLAGGSPPVPILGLPVLDLRPGSGL